MPLYALAFPCVCLLLRHHDFLLFIVLPFVELRGYWFAWSDEVPRLEGHGCIDYNLKTSAWAWKSSSVKNDASEKENSSERKRWFLPLTPGKRDSIHTGIIIALHQIDLRQLLGILATRFPCGHWTAAANCKGPKVLFLGSRTLLISRLDWIDSG